MKYRQIHDNEWITPVRRGYRMMCCQCGTVHDVDFRMKDGEIQFRPRANARATAAAGRKHKT